MRTKTLTLPVMSTLTAITTAMAITFGALGTASADGLDDLLADFKTVEYLHTTFVEDKRIALLAAPLTSEGAIQYAQPGLLLRTTTKPEATRMLIRPEALYMGSGEKADKIDFGANPIVRSFVDSFLLLLDGDRAGLEKTYAVEFKAMKAGWRLSLRPKNPPMTKMIKEMRFEGDGLKLTGMTVFELSGDETETKFTSIDTKAPPKKALDALFAAPAKPR